MNEFSADVAKEILASYPDWATHAREETYAGQTYLVIEPPTPTSANVEHGLRIDTYNDEITVSFDAYHSHFDTWDAEPGYEHAAALPFVRALLSEQIGIASWWHEDQWKGSSQLQRGERPAEEFVDGYNRIRVRSWQGALNEDRDA